MFVFSSFSSSSFSWFLIIYLTQNSSRILSLVLYVFTHLHFIILRIRIFNRYFYSSHYYCFCIPSYASNSIISLLQAASIICKKSVYLSASATKKYTEVGVCRIFEHNDVSCVCSRRWKHAHTHKWKRTVRRDARRPASLFSRFSRHIDAVTDRVGVLLSYNQTLSHLHADEVSQ